MDELSYAMNVCQILLASSLPLQRNNEFDLIFYLLELTPINTGLPNSAPFDVILDHNDKQNMSAFQNDHLRIFTGICHNKLQNYDWQGCQM